MIKSFRQMGLPLDEGVKGVGFWLVITVRGV